MTRMEYLLYVLKSKPKNQKYAYMLRNLQRLEEGNPAEYVKIMNTVECYADVADAIRYLFEEEV